MLVSTIDAIDPSIPLAYMPEDIASPLAAQKIFVPETISNAICMMHHKAIGMQLMCVSPLWGQPFNNHCPTDQVFPRSFRAVSSFRALAYMPEGLASPRQANISCQYFQTQKYCQKMRWLISSLQEQCLRSVVYFLFLSLSLANRWKS